MRRPPEFLRVIWKEDEGPRAAAPVEKLWMVIPYWPSEFPVGNMPFTLNVFVPFVYGQERTAAVKVLVHAGVPLVTENSAGVVGKTISK
jgi:hypothetical protein